MTPKEKANELIEDFAEIIPHIEYGVLMERDWKTAKQCALIAVDVEKNALDKFSDFWAIKNGEWYKDELAKIEEVKQEINNL